MPSAKSPGRNLLLDEAAIKSVNDGDRNAVVYKWLYRISTVMDSEQWEIERDVAFMLLQQLKTQVIISTAECIRPLLAKCISKVCQKGDISFIQDSITYLHDLFKTKREKHLSIKFFKAKSETSLQIKRNALSCLQEIYSATDVPASILEETLLILAKNLKTSENDLRVASISCLYSILKSLRSNNLNLSKEMCKQIKRQLTTDQDLVIRKWTIKCVQEMIYRVPTFSDFGSIVTLGVKSMKTSPVSLKSNMQDLVAKMISTAIEPSKEGSPKTPVQLETALNYLFSSVVNVGFPIFRTKITKNYGEIRTTIAQILSKIARDLGSRWFEHNYMQFASSILNMQSHSYSKKKTTTKDDSTFNTYLLLYTFVECFSLLSAQTSQMAATLKSCAIVLVSQKDEEAQVIGLKTLALLQNCVPDDVDLDDLFQLIIEFLKSKHENKVKQAAVFLNQILTKYPQLSSSFIRDHTENGGFERLLIDIMKHDSLLIRSAVEDILLNIMTNTSVYSIGKWFSIVKILFFGECYPAVVVPSENKDEYESDIENLNGVNEDKTVELPNWRTRIFALKLVENLLPNMDANTLQENEVDLSEIIRIAFVASNDNNIELRYRGLHLFVVILRTCSPIPDPVYPNKSILEQYQTQIVTVLIHTLPDNVSQEETNIGCEGISFLLKSGIVEDLSLIRRLCIDLTVKLNHIEKQDYCKSSCLSFLHAWSILYCIKYVKKDIYKQLPTTICDSLGEVDVSHLYSLTALWLEAVNTEWKLERTPASGTSSALLSDDWSSLILALSDRLDKANWKYLKYPTQVIFELLVDIICHILINGCDFLDEGSIKAYLYSLSILMSRSSDTPRTFMKIIEKALCSVLSMGEENTTKLLPALLSIFATAEEQIAQEMGEFSTMLISYIGHVMRSKNNQLLIDMYKSLSLISQQRKFNSLIIINHMADISKLVSLESYDFMLKKEGAESIQATITFIEFLLNDIEDDKKYVTINLLLSSLLRLLIEDVMDFWEDYSIERQNLHQYALAKLHSYSSLYSSELKLILSENSAFATVLQEGLTHQKDITKNTISPKMVKKQPPLIKLKDAF